MSACQHGPRRHVESGSYLIGKGIMRISWCVWGGGGGAVALKARKMMLRALSRISGFCLGGRAGPLRQRFEGEARGGPFHLHTVRACCCRPLPSKPGVKLSRGLSKRTACAALAYGAVAFCWVGFGWSSVKVCFVGSCRGTQVMFLTQRTHGIYCVAIEP